MFKTKGRFVFSHGLSWRVKENEKELHKRNYAETLPELTPSLILTVWRKKGPAAEKQTLVWFREHVFAQAFFLQSQHEELKKQHSDLEEEHRKQGEDFSRTFNDHKQRYLQLQQEKEQELSKLKGIW